MLPFFTNPYPDELLYSAIARYHFYSGNLDCKDTLEELFDSRSVIPSVEIGSHFTKLVENLGSQYSVEYLLANHTIYPYYASFLSKQRQLEILEDVKNISYRPFDNKYIYYNENFIERSRSVIMQNFLVNKNILPDSQSKKNPLKVKDETFLHFLHL